MSDSLWLCTSCGVSNSPQRTTCRACGMVRKEIGKSSSRSRQGKIKGGKTRSKGATSSGDAT
eukprot:5570063-Pyramimonas_sp.AAC.1